MRKLLSARYNAGAYNTGLLILRTGTGKQMANGGDMKLQWYGEM